jgi:hypothetical protein
MSLATYDGLLASIGSWLMRDDLAAVIPDFIALAEADMNSRLRLRSMLKRATTTIDADLSSVGYETLPEDCLQIWRLTLDGVELAFSGGLQMAGHALDWRGSAPMWFSVVGEQIQFAPTGPTPGGVIEMTYYARLPALSADVQTNAVLKAAPAAYLYGSLMQSAPYLADDQRVATWATLYGQACDLLQSADDAAEFPGPLIPQSGAWL